MGASRMGFDLTTKIGWQNLKYQMRWGINWGLVLSDTFGKFVCKAIGHNPFDAGDSQKGCYRCGKYI